MHTRYPIDRSFGVFARFSPPFGRGIFALARAALSLVPKGSRGVSVRRVRIAGKVPVRAYLISPEGEKGKLPCLVYFHGGGFVFKAAGYHYRNAAAYARTGCRVLFVDYRLAPEHLYPAASEDCFAAYLWAAEHAAELSVDPARLAVGGDSAGGCLAADVMFRVHRAGFPAPRFLLLVYPVLDRRMQTQSMQFFSDTPMWNARLNKKMWRYYCAGGQYCSPAEETDVSFFPPTYLETAQFDCLHDEGVAFADKLRAQGVPVTLRETAGTMHGYDIVRKSAITQESVMARCAVLAAALGTRDDQSRRKNKS